MTQPTVEERLTSLEKSFEYLQEGMSRVEGTLEKLDSSVADLIGRLDNRYPSQESVNLRFESMSKEIVELRKEFEETNVRVDKVRVWMYKAMGIGMTVTFVVGILAELVWALKG